MKFYFLFALCAISIQFTINCMLLEEPFVSFVCVPKYWVTTELRYLIREKQSLAKEAFIAEQIEKWQDLIGILDDLNKETSGAIRITVDPELAKTDPNKILYKDVFRCSAEDICRMIEHMNQAVGKWDSAQVKAKLSKTGNSSAARK